MGERPCRPVLGGGSSMVLILLGIGAGRARRRGRRTQESFGWDRVDVLGGPFVPD